MRTLARRDLILALAGIGVGAGLSWPETLGSNATTLVQWLRGPAAPFFANLPALRRLGALYLAARPEERSAMRLSHVLMSGADDSIPARLVGAISQDWSSHHVAVVDGWLLARTEARLCALLHLQEGLSA